MSTTSAAELADSMSSWIAERVADAGARTVVLGLSGGVDSAVVCGLCAKALGAERVVGVIMPSSSNPDDAVQAAKVATAFGVRTLTVDLTSISRTFHASMPTESAMTALGMHPDDDGAAGRAGLATANVRPRLRMTTLYYVANLVSGMVVGTGNKSEAMIGYFTKYGDGGVDMFPIIDLFKHEVRAVAAEIGVPQSVIDRPPSAGLWEGQTDETEIGMTYEQLDAALAAVVSGDTSGIEPAVLERVQGLHNRSAHKRVAVPAYRRNS